MFVLRVAGNIADPFVLGSIQYAVEHLGSRLIVVLGHERCGAIQAALAQAAGHGHFSGPLGELVGAIVPLVAPVYQREAGQPDAEARVLDEAVCANVCGQADSIRASLDSLSQTSATPEQFKHILVVGARYDLDDGTVAFFDAAAKAEGGQ